ILLVSLAVQRQKPEAFADRKLGQRARDRRKRRRLIVAAVKPMQGPVDTGQTDSRANSRAGGVLIKRAREPRQPDAPGKRQPGCRLALVLEEQGLEVPRRLFALPQIEPAPVSRLQPKERIVPLKEDIHSGLRVMPPRERAKDNLGPAV